MAGTLHEDLCTFMISNSLNSLNENVSDRRCTENQNAFFFPPENRAVYEIMWKNIVEQGRSQITI